MAWRILEHNDLFIITRSDLISDLPSNSWNFFKQWNYNAMAMPEFTRQFAAPLFEEIYMMAISNMEVYRVPLTVTVGLPLLQPTSSGQLVQPGIVAMSAVDGWQDQYCSASGHRCRNRCKVIIWPWYSFCNKVGRKMVCFSFLDAYFTLGMAWNGPIKYNQLRVAMPMSYWCAVQHCSCLA